MSDRIAINEAISSWFESRPTIRINGGSAFSDKKVWFWSDVFGTQPGRWKAIDYFTDEAANARLLDRLREKFPYLALVFEPDSVEVEASGCGNLENFYQVFKTPDRKTAVVLAFCKFAGIEAGQPAEGE